MQVLVFGTYDVRSHPRIGVLADGLRRHGFAVDECNDPLGVDTALRVALLRQPWRLPLFLLRLAGCWLRLARRARRMPSPDVLLVGYLGHFDVLLACGLFPRTQIVLDHLISGADTARDRGESGVVMQRLLSALDNVALRAADIVVVDTEEHRAVLPDKYRHKAVVAPVGAPDAWFAAAREPDKPGEDPLRAVFFGLFTPLQGAPVIGRALGVLAGEPIDVTMIGRGQDLDQAKTAAAGNQRVTWVDWVPSVELPKIVADHDVCLGIFGTGPKALRVVPNKVFQGAAAGCAIITSDTPPQQRVLGDAGVLTPPGDAQALAAALRRLADDRSDLTRLRRAARTLAQNEFTAERVVQPLVDRLPISPVAPRKLPPLPLNAWLRWDVVSRLLPVDGVTKVLEIGCGQGAFAARLAQRFDYLGLEPDAASYACAAARLAAAGGRGEVRNSELRALGRGEKFDLVCAFEVLEHLEDDKTALAEWVDRVRPGGWLMLSTPAFDDRMGPFDEVVGHYRRYDPPVMEQLLREAGLVDVQAVVYGVPLGYALEAARNVVGKHRLAKSAGSSMQDRTSGSGRVLQPDKPALGLAFQAVSAPFRRIQRAFPSRGTGLVALGRLPAALRCRAISR